MMLLRARVVLPISQPPIQDGAVLISGNRIVRVGRWRDLSSTSEGQFNDLGEVVLLPGLVNAHCHLDYTSMAGLFPQPKVFTDWIKLLTVAKAGWSYTDFAESWLKGARMLLRTGTTTVGDIEMAPELLPEVWDASPLRIISFLEMTGVKSRRDPNAILRQTVEHIERLPASRCRAALSPHAPYSTVPQLLRLSAEAATRRRWPLAIHVAESGLEFDMFMHGKGEMFGWISRSGRDMSDCGLGSPVRHLERCGALSPNLLAVHVNYLGTGDGALLGKRGVSVAHCPRSHVYFRHAAFPWQKLKKAGVNICLGTDSLASVIKPNRKPVQLDMFSEMRTFGAAYPGVSARTILRMATVNGAKALGLDGQVGALSEDAFADVIALPFNGKATGVWDAAVHHEGDVSASMIDGRWAIAPPHSP
jgi:cytosine/adenosine deaminase-related metal-dependent hydrolase